LIPGQHPYDDLGPAIQVPTAEEPTPAIHHINDVPIVRLTFDAGNRSGEDPRVPADQWLLPSGLQEHLSHPTILRASSTAWCANAYPTGFF
jgi:hypothetical protein